MSILETCLNHWLLAYGSLCDQVESNNPVQIDIFLYGAYKYKGFFWNPNCNSGCFANLCCSLLHGCSSSVKFLKFVFFFLSFHCKEGSGVHQVSRGRFIWTEKFVSFSFIHNMNGVYCKIFVNSLLKNTCSCSFQIFFFFIL